MENTPPLLLDTDLVSRLRRVLSASDLGPRCSDKIEHAVARFASLEQRRIRRKALAEAREHKDWMIPRLAFLAELDEITDREIDATVFAEVAIIFDEIGASATKAAVAVRSIACSREMGSWIHHH